MKKTTTIVLESVLVSGIFSVLVLAAPVGMAAWSEPVASPPGSNVDAPLNVGSAAQTKSGGLTVSGGVTSTQFCFSGGNCATSWDGMGGGGGGQWVSSTDPLGIYYLGGRIGVGTSSPAHMLHVAYGGGNAEINIQSGSQNYWGVYHDAATEDLRFYNADAINSGDAVVIGNSGIVGIGTLDPLDAILGVYDYSSESETYHGLHVQSPQNGRIVVESGYGAAIGLISTSATSNKAWFEILTQGGLTKFLSRNNNGTVNKTIMAMDHGNGNVGIGTSTPESKLTLIASGTNDVTFTLRSGSTGNILARMGQGSGNQGYFIAHGSDGSNQAVVNGFGASYFKGGSTAFGSSTIPASPAASQVYIEYQSGYGLRLNNAGGSAYDMITNSNNTGRLTAGGVWASASSRKFKENFEQVSGDDMLEKINQLELVKYNYINESDSFKHFGAMAEEWYSVFGLGDNSSISGNDVGMVALKGIQQLSQEISNLKDQIATVSASEVIGKLADIREPNVKFNDIDNVRVTNYVSVHGGSSFYGTMNLAGGANFFSRVVFNDHVYFDGDAAGVATVAAGSNSMEINFAKPYKTAPIVTLTPKSDLGGISYWVSDETVNGFIINLSVAKGVDMDFNWHAIAVSADSD